MLRLNLPDFSIRKIAESGQCFRIREAAPGVFALQAKGRYLEIHEEEDGDFTFSCTPEEFEREWYTYFDLAVDYRSYTDIVPASDHYMKEAVFFSQGMKILRQDPWEMLVSFLISQNKNIPGIAGCVEKLCAAFGEPFMTEAGLRYAFPVPDAIARGSDEGLCACSLGYRASYIKSAAEMVAGGILNLASLQNEDDRTLSEALLTVPGVGPKVAACVMLFGFHRLDAFPKDVWIKRIIENEYGGAFPESSYPGSVGVLQQYLFYYARKHVKKNTKK